jgi:hypothetical protein
MNRLKGHCRTCLPWSALLLLCLLAMVHFLTKIGIHKSFDLHKGLSSTLSYSYPNYLRIEANKEPFVLQYE